MLFKTYMPIYIFCIYMVLKLTLTKMMPLRSLSKSIMTMDMVYTAA